MTALIIRLLTILNTEPIDSTMYHIAEVLLQNYSEIQENSIGEMAKLANVSKSTLSKFARELGFDNYIHLKDSSNFIENRENNYYTHLEKINKTMKTNNYKDYFKSIREAADALENNLDFNAVQRLAFDLNRYSKVGILGLFFSESAAVDFQYKLAFAGKFVHTFQNDLKQNEFIRNADDNTLLIIISHSGDFLRYNQLYPTKPKKNMFTDTKAHIFAITSDTDILKLPYVKDAIIYPATSGLQSHLFQYPALIDLIVSQYLSISKQNREL